MSFEFTDPIAATLLSVTNRVEKAAEPIYKKAIDECFAVLREHGVHIDGQAPLKDYVRQALAAAPAQEQPVCECGPICQDKGAPTCRYTQGQAIPDRRPLQHDNVRDNIGQALADKLVEWSEENSVTLDPFDSRTVDELADAVIGVLGAAAPAQEPPRQPQIKRWFMHPENGCMTETERGSWVRYVDHKAVDASRAAPAQEHHDWLDAQRFRKLPGVKAVINGVMLDDTSGIEQWRNAVDCTENTAPAQEKSASWPMFEQFLRGKGYNEERVRAECLASGLSYVGGEGT